MKNVKCRIMGIMCVILMMVMVAPAMVFASDDENGYDDSEYQVMSQQEVNAIMLERGISLNKLVQVGGPGDVALYTDTNVIGEIIVAADHTNKRIAVMYYTCVKDVVYEIGIKNFTFYEGSTVKRGPEQDYTRFKNSYEGGYYYTKPKSGKTYHATGYHYIVLSVSYRSYGFSAESTSATY